MSNRNRNGGAGNRNGTGTAPVDEGGGALPERKSPLRVSTKTFEDRRKLREGIMQAILERAVTPREADALWRGQEVDLADRGSRCCR